LTSIIVATGFAVFILLTFAAWRRYVWVAEKAPHEQADTCQYRLTDVFGGQQFVNVPHQKGIRWLTEVFSRSAEKFPHLTALQIPHTGESLTFAEARHPSGKRRRRRFSLPHRGQGPTAGIRADGGR
jgi:hypothetical protein